MSKKPRNVVITGASIASPAGYTLEENVSAWNEGRQNFTEITRFNMKGSSVRYAGECPRPNVKTLPDRKVQKILRRKDVIALIANLDAAKSANLAKGDIAPERIGMYTGAACTQTGDLQPYFELVAECADIKQQKFDSNRFGAELAGRVTPLAVLQTLMNNALCFGTMTLDIRGVNANFMDFQIAGLRAIGESLRSIQDDRCDIAFAGGIAAPVEPFQLSEGVSTGYLAATGELKIPVQETVRPYDRDRKGAILSEGSAWVVLEEEEHALRRGAKILGRVHGYSLCADGSFEFMNEKRSPGLVRAMAGALAEAGMNESDLGAIIGHGNGSRSADGAEARSYVEYFGDRAGAIPMTSPKSVLGDLCEAGGVINTILALETLRTHVVPPTYNFTHGDEFSEQLSLAPEAQDCKQRRAAVTGRNFLGVCTTLVVGEP